MVHNLLEQSLQASSSTVKSVEDLIEAYNRIAQKHDGITAVRIAIKVNASGSKDITVLDPAQESDDPEQTD
jgi:hypothetical protein